MKSNQIEEQLNRQKVAIYVRVSTHWQVDKDSLQVQRRELTAYSEMVLGIKSYEIFEDPGYSAKNTDRPDYQRMMDRLRTGEFSHLLVWKIDRISRNLLDFAEMYRELKTLGVTFVSKNEQFDTSSAIGEAMLKIILVFAELERNMTSERVTAVMLSRANNGQWNGGRIPFGYSWSKEKREFSLVESEASVIRRIFNLYEESQSVLNVSRTLNEDGLRTRAGNEWSAVVIHEILKNQFYVGDYIYNRRKDGNKKLPKEDKEVIVYENHHEPIISQIQFDRVQFILQRNWRGGYQRGETHRKKTIHLFAGLLKCGNCGSSMTATADRRRATGLRPSIYGCSKRRNTRNECENKFTSDITLGPFVFNYIANILRAQKSTTASTGVITLERKLLRGKAFSKVEHIDPTGLGQIRELFLKGETGLEFKPVSIFNASPAPAGELERCEERLRKYEKALNRLHSLYLYGESDVSEKDYVAARDKIEQEIEQVKSRIAELKAEIGPAADDSGDDFADKASYFIMVQKLLENDYVDYEKYIAVLDANIPRNFLLSVIETVEVTNGEVTSIRFKNGMIHSFQYKE